MSRETYEANIAFIDQTVKRLERNEVSIDELETLAREFADARKFCTDRLTRIESVVQATLGAEEGQSGERT
ncbi:exodeoxyribonuclease VII small subunit [Pseudomonas weihenstephanensis]|mgnify:FL=1|uniref:Exodeoxyribonuclease VII small subunit n=1 Tax=Pseudomonas weihenstephanensis TaxID=1608994 RepID=A0ABS1ZMF5_9PSED|nr:exodeoxyribonuclease VII small subunit [Pseudomonas weihenstephanensis]MBM1197655.1 exodeoxyribonuclease VII small subunit [Pseudomonas weihenstephanensis]